MASYETAEKIKANNLPHLPIEQRHSPLYYEGGKDGNTIAYPINWDEIYNLKGRLLTLVDATFTDPEQRKAYKDLVWSTLKAWMDDIETADEGFRKPTD